jgi:cell division protein FtsQ
LAIGLIGLLAFSGGGIHWRAGPLVAEIERWAALAGFGLEQASVTGYRFTADGDIFDAIELDHARTLLSFDSRAAQARIEELPWVDKASITRVLPDRIEVRITERTPFALWQRGERNFLVDRTGRVLASVAHTAMPDLPRVAGRGAPEAAAGLFAMLAAHPSLLAELALAERIGERRWRLKLADGSTIELPAQTTAETLARAVAIDNTLRGHAKSIDLRVAGRTLVGDLPTRDADQSALDALLASGL